MFVCLSTLHYHVYVLLVLVFDMTLVLIPLIATQLFLPILIDHTLFDFFVLVYLQFINPVDITCRRALDLLIRVLINVPPQIVFVDPSSRKQTPLDEPQWPGHG